MRDAGHDVSLYGSMVPQASSVILASWLAGSFTTPSQAAIREETVRQIDDALAGMDSIDREVLILRHFEQLSNDEVAAALGVKKAAASRRYIGPYRGSARCCWGYPASSNSMADTEFKGDRAVARRIRREASARRVSSDRGVRGP